MKHEKIIKRESIEYRLEVSIFIPNSWDKLPMRYDMSVQMRDKGKRKWSNLPSGDTLTDHLSEEEILQAKLEFWEKLKP